MQTFFFGTEDSISLEILYKEADKKKEIRININ